VHSLWKKMLDENEKIAKARLAAIQVVVDDVEKDAKAFSKVKQSRSKAAFERLAAVQKDLQASVSEVIFFTAIWH
jgi:hypothetical protein